MIKIADNSYQCEKCNNVNIMTYNACIKCSKTFSTFNNYQYCKSCFEKRFEHTVQCAGCLSVIDCQLCKKKRGVSRGCDDDSKQLCRICYSTITSLHSLNLDISQFVKDKRIRLQIGPLYQIDTGNYDDCCYSHGADQSGFYNYVHFLPKTTQYSCEYIVNKFIAHLYPNISKYSPALVGNIVNYDTVDWQEGVLEYELVAIKPDITDS